MVIHRKLVSNPLKFQQSKRSEEARKPTNQGRRCGRFSHDEHCETHKRLMAERFGKTGQQQDKADTSKSFPKMPMREQEEHTVITITTDRQAMDGEESAHHEENNPEMGEATETDEVAELYAPPPTAAATSRTLSAQTPMPTSPIVCSTAHVDTPLPSQRDHPMIQQDRPKDLKYTLMGRA